MRNHKGTQLYKTSIKLTAQIAQVTQKADRGYRFTVGEKMIDAAMKVTKDFYQAYKEHETEKKKNRIEQCSQDLEELMEWLDVAHELGFFSYKSFPKVLEQYSSIERQLAGWNNGIAKVPVIKDGDR